MYIYLQAKTLSCSIFSIALVELHHNYYTGIIIVIYNYHIYAYICTHILSVGKLHDLNSDQHNLIEDIVL